MMKVVHACNDSFDVLWKDALRRIKGATPMYSLDVRKFDYEVFSGDLKRDDSFVVLSDSNETIAFVPLYCFADEYGKLEYRYAGEYLRAPLIYDAPYTKRYEKTQKFVFMYIEDLAKRNNVRAHKAIIEGIELLEGRHYYNYLTDFGYSDESSVCQLIDLSRENKYLWSDVRKSYKSLINRATKNFIYETISSKNYNFNKCEDYRKLHLNAAGKQTRSLESFYLMYNMVKNNQAFIILIREKSGWAVAAHFYYFLGAYCLYASSAIDPDLPSDSGAGHLALWQGVLTARQLGCRFIDMGQLWINSSPSEKEKNIALFKRGFGGRTVTVFRGTKHFKT